MALVQGLNRSGLTIVVVTHDAGVACHAQRILRFQDGMLLDDERAPGPDSAEPRRAAEVVR